MWILPCEEASSVFYIKKLMTLNMPYGVCISINIIRAVICHQGATPSKLPRLASTLASTQSGYSSQSKLHPHYPN